MPIGIQEKQERDSFDAFLDTLKEEREVISETAPVDPEPIMEPGELPEFDTAVPDPVIEQKKIEVAMIPAETIVDVIDTTAISVNSYIAQEPQDGASPAEKQSLQKAIANYLRETDVDISPGKMCVLLILMIYGPKIMQAFQTRKLNQENEQLRAHVANLEQQLSRQQHVTKPNEDGQVPGM